MRRRCIGNICIGIASRQGYILSLTNLQINNDFMPRGYQFLILRLGSRLYDSRSGPLFDGHWNAGAVLGRTHHRRRQHPQCVHLVLILDLKAARCITYITLHLISICNLTPLSHGRENEGARRPRGFPSTS